MQDLKLPLMLTKMATGIAALPFAIGVNGTYYLPGMLVPASVGTGVALTVTGQGGDLFSGALDQVVFGPDPEDATKSYAITKVADFLMLILAGTVPPDPDDGNPES